MLITVPPDTDEVENLSGADTSVAIVEEDAIPISPDEYCLQPSAYRTLSQMLEKAAAEKKAKKRRKKQRKKRKLKKAEAHMLSYYKSPPTISPADAIREFERNLFLRQPELYNLARAPDKLVFDPHHESAFFLGQAQNGYVGKPENYDGHIAVFGGSGSGKSSGIAIPTIATWRSSIFAIDFKGELVAQALQQKRKSKILNLLSGAENDCWYDVFYFLRQDDSDNVVQNARELAQAIIPLPHDAPEPFWIMCAQNVLTGAILYYFDLGAEFIEAMICIKTTPISHLLRTISANTTAGACINLDISETPKLLAGISAELHNRIAVFATDKLVQKVLSPSEELHLSPICWEDLEHEDIFIRVDHRRIRQWDGVLRLMLVQLIRTLESRPEKYSPEGAEIPPTLLLLDEFPQYGKIDIITSALQTLRSKNTTIALFCQSLSDLDMVYGVKTRCSIVENCPFKVVLNASDAETQRYFSSLVGTAKFPNKGISTNFNEIGQAVSYSIQIAEVRDLIIQPHEFAALQDIVLLHPEPERFCRLGKIMHHRTDTIMPKTLC